MNHNCSIIAPCWSLTGVHLSPELQHLCTIVATIPDCCLRKHCVVELEHIDRLHGICCCTKHTAPLHTLRIAVGRKAVRASPGPTMMVFAGSVLGHSTSQVPITNSTSASHFRVLRPRSHLKPSVNGQLLAAHGSPYCCRSWFRGEAFQSSQVGTSLL
jgi:hypothetical protein